MQIYSLVRICLVVLVFAFSPGLQAESPNDFAQRVDAEAKARRASCEEFKSLFAPLESKDRVNGRLVLKRSSDIDRAVMLISSFDVSAKKRNDLREEFFRNSKPTTMDVLSYAALDSASCIFPLFSALTRTIETAGESNDPVVKQKVAVVLKNWFAARESNQEGLINVAIIPLLFKAAVKGSLLKATEADRAVLEAISKESRKKSSEFSTRFKSDSKGISDSTTMTREKSKREDQNSFDPVKLQKFFTEERDVAKKINASLKAWLAER